MSVIWHNGKFLNDEPVFTAHDRMRLGECVFATMLAADGKIIRVTQHLEKLFSNAQVFFGEWAGPDAHTLETAATELLRRNNYTSGRYAVNIIVTRGPSGNGIRPPENPVLQTVMRALPLSVFPPVHAIIATGVRRNEGSPLSQIKCGNYGENILAMREASEKGANEALIMNNAGNIACASTSSLFILRQGRLVTPPLSDGAQKGVTRALLMDKYGTREESLTPGDLEKAEGIYLANSLRGVVAVETLDGRKLPRPSLEIDKEFHLT